MDISLNFVAKGGSRVAQSITAMETNAKRARQETARAGAQSRTEEQNAERAATAARIREVAARAAGTLAAEQRVRTAIEQTTKAFEKESGKKVSAGSREAKFIEQLVRRRLNVEEHANAQREKADARAADTKKRNAERELTNSERAEQRKTKAAEREEKQRVRESEKAEKDKTRAADKEERERTKIARAGEREREKARREASQRAGRVTTALSVGVNAAMAFAGDYAGQVQGARTRRAASDRTLNGAFIQAGVASIPEAGGLRAMVAASAKEQGIKYEDLAAAVNVSQSSFNSLGAGTMDERRAKLGSILKATTFANDMHADMGQIAKLQGLLAQNGIQGPQQEELIQRATQLSFNGSVEVGDMLKTGLGPMMKYINTEMQKLGPGATKEQRQKVYGDAMLDAMAQAQIQASVGNTTRWSSSRYANLDSVLQSPNTAGLLHRKLAGTFKEGSTERLAVEAAFTKNDQGKTVLAKQFQNPAQFAALMASVFKDGASFRSAVGSRGGGVKSQALQKADAELLSVLMAKGDDGKYLYESIGSMVANSRMTPEQIATAHALTQDEEQTKLNRAEEENAQALTDNTSAANRVANALNDLKMKNPMLSSLASAAMPAIGMMAGGGMKNFLTKMFLGGGPGGAGGAGDGIPVAAPIGAMGRLRSTLSQTPGEAGVMKTAGLLGLAAVAGAGLGTALVRAGDELIGYHAPHRKDGSTIHDTLFEKETYGELDRAINGNDAPGNQSAAATLVRGRQKLAAVLKGGGEAALNNLQGDDRANAQDLLHRAANDLSDASIEKLAKALGVAVSQNPPKVSLLDVMHAMSLANTAKPTGAN